jgi:5-methylcytosine-specific restriction endonuclease McrA
MPARSVYVSLTCPACGIVFTCKPSQASYRKYCSRTCKDANHHPVQVKFAPIVTKICAYCGKEFSKKLWEGGNKHKYCTITCAYAAMYPPKPPCVCEWCGCTYTPTHRSKNTPNRYCSRKCMAESHVGPGHSSWRGGGREYRGTEWNKQRAAARERDKDTCQHCGVCRKGLDVHHIVPYRVSHSNKASNLITLCRKCHMIAERDYWAKQAAIQFPLF